MLDKERLETNLLYFRPAIIAFSLVLIMATCFILGGRFSCASGYMDGLTCIEPKQVATVTVCETNPYSCVENCVDFQIKKPVEFCKTWYE